MHDSLSFFDANLTLGTENVVPRGRYLDVDSFQKRMKECSITGGLAVHNAAVEGDPVTGNPMLTDCIVRIPGLIPAWVLLPFGAGELGTPGELLDRMRQANVRAVVFYPSNHRFSASEWSSGDIYDLCEAASLPFFTRFDIDLGADAIDSLLTRHPKLQLVLRNANYSMTRNLYRLFDLHPLLRVETSRFFPFGGIEDVVRRFGAERLVFGSGMPTCSPGAAVAPIAMSSIDEESKRAIAGGNLRSMIEAVCYE